MFKRRIRIILVASAMAIAGSPAAASQIGPPSSELQKVSQAAQPVKVPEVEKQPLGTPSNAISRNEPGTGDITGGQPAAQLGLSKTLGSLMVVVGLMLILVMLFRWVSARKGGIIASLGPSGRAPSGIIEILARYPIARTQRLVLLRIGNRVILCCQTSGAKSALGAMTTLTEITDPEEVASILRTIRDQDGSSNRSAFKDALKDAEKYPEEPDRKADSVLEYVSPQGDTFQWQDERVKISPDKRATGTVDPSIGRLQARLAAMRSSGESA